MICPFVVARVWRMFDMDYTILVSGICGLALLYFIYEVEWKRYRLDKLRDDLFVIRDDLFRAAANGDISFDSDAYKIIRTNLNGMIRFSHDLSFFRFMLVRGEVKKPAGRAIAGEYRNRIAGALEQLTPEQRALIVSVQKKVHDRVLVYLAFNSLLGCVCFGIVSVLALITFIVREGIKAIGWNSKDRLLGDISNIGGMKRRIEALDAEANNIGCLA